MMDIAIIADGGFIIQRTKAVKKRYMEPKVLADFLYQFLRKEIPAVLEAKIQAPVAIFRIMYHDCYPYEGEVINPFSGTKVPSRSSHPRKKLLEFLSMKENISVREGNLAVNGWKINNLQGLVSRFRRRGKSISTHSRFHPATDSAPADRSRVDCPLPEGRSYLKGMSGQAGRQAGISLRGEASDHKGSFGGNEILMNVEEDFVPNYVQKGVDTNIVIDIMKLSTLKAIQGLVLVSSDADFVPCIRFAKEQGLRVFLLPLGKMISRDLLNEVDATLESSLDSADYAVP
jgi:uncharacterized LabA/DUF88 family protein